MSLPPPPNTATCDKDVYAVARFLRHSETIKQRPALLGGQRYDMFRCKRAARALLSPEYAKAQQSNKNLPKITTKNEAYQILAKFPPQSFAFNVTKLETEDALAQGFKPLSGIPVTLLANNQRVGDDEYMLWIYNPTPLKTYLYGIGLLAVGAALAFYQMWPKWARQGAYYVSIGSIVLLATLIILGVVRLVLFILSLFVSRGFWLFPNLFADVGFFQSFQPLYSWRGENTLPQKPKPKKRKPKTTKPAQSAPPAQSANAAQSAPSAPAAPAPAAAPGAPIVPGAPLQNLPPNPHPMGTVMLGMMNGPNGEKQPILLQNTPKGTVMLGPTNVAKGPNGQPMIPTPAGLVPVAPNGVLMLPPGISLAKQPTDQDLKIQEAIARCVAKVEKRRDAEMKKSGDSKDVVEKRLMAEEAQKEPALAALAAKLANK